MVQLILILVCGLFVYWLWRQHFQKTNEPPGCSGWLPIVGHGHQLIGDMTKLWRFIQKITEESLKLGGAASISLGPSKKMYVLTDPDDSWQIANLCLEKSNIYNIGKEWVGEGLITSKVAIWKRHRKMLNPAFKQAALDEYLGAFNQQAARTVAALATEASKGPFDSMSYMERSALETVCLTTLKIGFDDTTILDGQYLRVLKKIYDIFVKRIMNTLMHNEWNYRWTSLKREYDECVKILHSVTNSVIQTKRNEKKDSKTLIENERGDKFKSFVEILLEQEAEDAFTDQEIREELDTIIAAGVDTTATTLTYILVFLGTYPDVQKRLCKELEDIFGKSDRPVEKSDLKNLVYTEAVIKECMRLLPLIPCVVRYLDRDVKLKNYTLYAGNECMISLYGVGRHRMWGRDAREFRPERFLDPAALPDHPAAFAGFSFGKRGCIGKVYSMMFMKTTLAHVFRHYTVAADYNKMVLKMGIQVRPITGHHISITKKT